MKSIEIIPTIVPDSLSNVEEVSKKYSDFASLFQIDIADGAFAPNTTWAPSGGYKLPTSFSYEAHLMVKEPYELGLTFANAGAETIIGHLEAFGNAESATHAIDDWKKAGAKSVGIAILFQTPLEDIEPYLSLADFALFMTIASIGVQGIPFEAKGISRISEFKQRHPGIEIAVDGGVSESNIVELARAGATRFGVGSAISKAKDPKLAYERLKTLAENAIQ